MGSTKSLFAQGHFLSDSSHQIDVLSEVKSRHPGFSERLEDIGLQALKAGKIEIMQVNLGKMCNQTCKHCHVDAGPDRKEIMTRDTLMHVLVAIKSSGVSTVDLTGGAPEMNPEFRWFVQELNLLDLEIIVRCNLTIILSNPRYKDLPEFYKSNNVTVISSLPHYSARRVDAQRGEGVFDKSIEALKLLNSAGYGEVDSGLKLHLVYNPSGAFLPPSQESLQKDFKKRLMDDFNIHFNELYVITNMPISRFLDYLIESNNYNAYMDKLVEAFNPAALSGLMCRNTLSIGWDGQLYDCDFNQMLDLDIQGKPNISDFNSESLEGRNIIVNQHCFGCTAGAGSSCGGEIV